MWSPDFACSPVLIKKMHKCIYFFMRTKKLWIKKTALSTITSACGTISAVACCLYFYSSLRFIALYWHIFCKEDVLCVYSYISSYISTHSCPFFAPNRLQYQHVWFSSNIYSFVLFLRHCRRALNTPNTSTAHWTAGCEGCTFASEAFLFLFAPIFDLLERWPANSGTARNVKAAESECRVTGAINNVLFNLYVVSLDQYSLGILGLAMQLSVPDELFLVRNMRCTEQSRITVFMSVCDISSGRGYFELWVPAVVLIAVSCWWVLFPITVLWGVVPLYLFLLFVDGEN